MFTVVLDEGHEHFRGLRAQAGLPLSQRARSVRRAVLQGSDYLWFRRELILRQLVGGVVGLSPVCRFRDVSIPERHMPEHVCKCPYTVHGPVIELVLGDLLGESREFL